MINIAIFSEKYVNINYKNILCLMALLFVVYGTTTLTVYAQTDNPPTIIAASVTSATEIVLTYSENIEVPTTNGTGFALSTGGTVTANTDPASSGNVITLTVSGITNTSDTPAITYTESLGTVTDSALNPAADQIFDRTTDDAPPMVSSIATSGTSTVDVILSEDVIYNLAAPEDFVLFVQSDNTLTSMTIGEITAVDNTLTLDHDATLASDDVINLEYNKATGSIDDIIRPSFVDSFSVASQELFPRDLVFSNDGTKMFVTGDDGDDVNEYALSAPFDISNAAFVDSFSVADEDETPIGLAFSANGTRMFVVGDDSNKVYKYALSAPFDISNVTSDSSFLVSTETTSPRGLAFSNDGYRMFILSASNDTVYQYTLSAPFDVSTAVSSSFFSAASQDPLLIGLAFSADGTRMFVAGSDNDKVYQYALTAPFDVSNAAFIDSFSVRSQDGSPRGLAFSADGARMFVVGDDNDNINEYALPKPFTLFPQPNSLASFAAFSVENNIPSDTTPPTITAASVTSATNITLTYSENIDADSTDGAGFTLSVGQVTANTDPGGSGNTITLTVSGITNTSDTPVITYAESLGTVIDTASNPAADQTFDHTTDDAPPTVSSIATATMSIIDIVLSENVAYNSAAPEDFVLSGTISPDSAVTAIAVIADTVTLFLDGMLAHDDVINLAYTRTTGSINDIPSPPSFVDSFSVSSQDGRPQGLAFSNDGTKMFVVGDDNDEINEYTLSIPFDVSTATFVDFFPVDSQDSSPQGLAFSNDGTKMFVVGNIGDEINEYTLSIPFDVSTATFVDFFPVDSQDTIPRDIAFSNDGTKMFVVGNDDNDINEYTLSAPFDVSTATFVDSFPVALHASSPRGLAFSDDGHGMFVVGHINVVVKYELTASFDVSTASHVTSFSVKSQDGVPSGLAFSNDGTRMFVLDNGNDAVREYALSDPFTLFPQPNSLASFAATLVKNNIAPPDTTPPTITAAAVTSLTEIVLTYSENIDVTTTDGQGFTLSDGQVTANTDPGNSGNTITLTVSGITISDAPNVIYTASDGSVADSALNQAANQTFTDTTDSTAPTVSSIGTAGTSTIDIVLSKNVTINGAAPEDFALSGTISTDPAVTGITADANTVTLSLDDMLDGNDVINLTYDKTTGSIDDIPVPPSFVTSFPVSSQDSTPQGLALSADGTRMFVLGSGGGAVHQHTLTAPFDLSTASYDNIAFSVTDQEPAPRDVAFSNDGTKMFVLGDGNNDINEYALSAAFDISNVAGTSDVSNVTSFSVASQESSPQGLTFSADGSKMFVTGFNGGDVYQYALSAPFDVSTASYDNISFTVSLQDSDPRDVAFSADGSRMFVVGSSSDSVHEYTLTAPFDVSTASHVTSFSVESQDGAPSGLAFSGDGTRMFVTGDDNDAVYEYSVSEPFTLFLQPNSLASFAATPVKNNISPFTIIASSLTSATEIVLTYDENIDVNATDGTGFSLSVGQVTANSDPAGSDNTITLTVSGIAAGSDTPDVTYTASDGTVTDNESNPAPDQTFIDTTGGTTLTVSSAATAGTSAIHVTLSEDVTINGAAPGDFALSGDISTDPTVTGIAAIANTVTLSLDDTLDHDDVISLAYDKTTGSIDYIPLPPFAGSFPVDSQDRTPVGLAFSNDGTKMFVTGSQKDRVYQYALTEPFDVSSASYSSKSFSVESQDEDPRGLAFSNDGTKMFVSGDDGNDINEYALTAPFDVSTASHADSFSVSSQDNSVRGLAFSANGTKMFVVGDGNNAVYQYALSAPFDISNVTGTSDVSFVTSFSVSSQEKFPFGLAFSDDGTRMFVVGNDINEYILSAPFDVSTARFDRSFPIDSQDSEQTDLAFSADGTRIFVVGNGNDSVYQYALSDPFTLSPQPDSLASFAAISVTNDIPDTTPPAITAAAVTSATEILLTYSENIDVATTDGQGFTLSDGGTVTANTNPAGTGNTITLTVSGITASDAPAITYTAPPGSVADTASNQAADQTFTGTTPLPDDTPPAITAAAVTSATEILLTYSENIDVNATDGTGFALSDGQVSANTDPAGTDNTITLTVSDITDTSDAPAITYTAPPGTVTDTASNPAANQTFTGTTDDAPPTVSSIGTAGISTIDIVLSKNVTINGAAPEDFVLSGNITADPVVTGITAVANTVTLSLDDTLDHDDDILLAYTRTTGSIDEGPFATFDSSLPVASQDIMPFGIAFSNDGMRMFVSGVHNSAISEYALTAPFDVSTATFDSSLSVASEDLSPHGLTFSNNGTRMFVVGSFDQDINEYALAAPFDISDATFVDSLPIVSKDAEPQDLAFSNDGTRLFVTGSDNDAVHQYALDTAFDISTASAASSSLISFSVESQDDFPIGLTFSNDGYGMFVVGGNSNAVYRYALAAPFDISTASHAGSFQLGFQDTSPRGLTFSDDGSRMFVVSDAGNASDAVHGYALSEPFKLFSQSASLASFAATTVTNNIPPDTIPPAITAAAVTSAASITLTYSENIDVSTTNGTGFALSTTGGTVTANTDPAGTDNTITLTISGITDTSDTPDITYTASDGTVADNASNPAADQTFAGTTDDAPPTVSSIATSGTSTSAIDIILSEDVTINGAAPGDFVLSGNITADPVVTGITVAAAAADTVTLSLDGTLDHDDVILLAYTRTTGSIGDGPAAHLAGSFPIDLQDSSPIGLAFSTDGTRMFVVDLSDNAVYQYALTTPFDVSTATFVTSFSVSSQDINPRGLTFSATGTKMFVLGSAGGGNVHQYALSAAFDISNVAGTSDVSFVTSFSISSQDINPRDLAFSADGTRMFVAGIGNSAVYQYALAAPFDVSSASFDDTSFPVVRQDRNPTGLAFSANGMQMFVTGDDGNDINEYALDTAFDVSDADFVGSFSVESHDSSPAGLTFSANGMQMFVAGIDSNAVYQYALPEPFMLFSQPNSLASFAATTVTNNIASPSPPPDGTDPPIDDTVPPEIIAAAVTSATEILLTYSEDIDVTTTNGEGFTLSTGTVTANTNPAGTDNTITLTVSGITTSDAPVITYIAPPGTVVDAESNPAADQTFTGTTDDAPPTVSSIATAGTSTINIVLSENVTINGAAPEDFALSSTISTDPAVTGITAVTNNTVALALDDTLDSNDVILLAYTKTTGSIDDIPLPPLLSSFPVGMQDQAPTGMAFSNDGTRMFVVSIGSDSDNDAVHQYTLTAAFDVSTATFVDSFSVGSQDTVPRGVAFSADGTKMFVVGSFDNNINEYTLTAAFDVSTAAFVDSFSVASQDILPLDMAFSGDGTKMFVLGGAGDDINEYTLSAPFDVSNVAGTSDVTFVDSFPVASQDRSTQGLTFSADGTRMFVVGSINGAVYGYALTAPFDVSTATFVDSFSVTSQDRFPRGLAFSADGTRIFVLGSDSENVHQYALSEPFTLFQQPNSLASFEATLVTNNIGSPPPDDIDPPIDDTVPPEIIAAAVTSLTEITLTYSEDIDVTTTDGTGFALSDGGTVTANTDPAGMDNTITLTVSGITASDAPVITYTAPPGTVTDTASNQAANQTFTGTTPLPDDTPPTITAAAVTSLTEILLTYSENIDVTTTDGQGFILSVGQVTANTNPAGTGNTITLTVSGITASDAPAITYTAPPGTVVDSALNPAANQTFTDTTPLPDDTTPLPDDTVPPTLTVSSIATAGTSAIDIVLSEDVTINGAAPGDFALSGDISADPVVTGITAAADTVTLTLNDTLDHDDVILLAYNKTTGSIDDIPLPSLASSFSVALEDTFPHGLAFSDDGTRMFVMGSGNDAVYQYALTTPFDVSIASFDVSTASIDDFSLSPRSLGLAFSANGTGMFVVGHDIYQYTLAAPFDVSTASLDSSFSVESQESFPQSLAFSDDGTGMFVVGDDIYQYTLSTPFDILTASYDDISFSVSSQESSLRDVAFSDDGTRMFVVGDDIYQYALTAPFDISTASHDSSFSVSSQESSPRGLAFSDDGTRMFVAGIDNSAVYQYALPEPFMLFSQPNSLASFAATLVTNNISSDTVAPAITAAAVTSLTEITLTYSENIDVTTTDGQGFALSTTGGTVTANTNPAGTDNTITLTVSGITASDAPAITYTAPPGTVVDTASNSAANQTFTDTTPLPDDTTPLPDDTVPPTLTVSSVATAGTSAIDIVLSKDVTINGAAPGDFVLSGTISADPTVTGITAAADTVTLTLNDTLDHDDVILLAYDKTTGSIDDIPAASAFPDGSFSVRSQDPTPNGLAFSADGTRMFVTGNNFDAVYQYTLAAPFDVSNVTGTSDVSHVDRFLVDSQDSSPRGLAFSADGTKMFVVGSSSDSVHEYALTTAFDVSTATIDSSFSVESQDSSPRGLAFSADGTKMFVVGSSSASVHEYALTSAFDVSSATIDSSFSVESQDTSPRGLAFSADGTKMFVVGSSSDSVHEYALTTAFDVSTATIDSSFSVESQDSSPAGLAFSGDGTSMFVLGFDGANVHQYALSEPFTLLPQPNSLASFEAIPVTNNIASPSPPDGTDPPPDDTVAPAITAAAVTSLTEITLTYSEDIDVTTTDGQGFTLSDGQVSANTDPAGTDNTITLTVSGITASDAPAITYTAPPGTVVDSALNSAANQTFTGTTPLPDDTTPLPDDTVPPTLTVSSIATAGTSTIDIVLSEDVTINGAAPEDFVLSGTISTDPVVTEITAIAAANTVTLTLNDTLDHDDVILLAYTKTTGSIDDIPAASAFPDGSFSVGSQDTTPNGLAFSANGTSMFVIGSGNDAVYQYTLAAPFDVSNVTGTSDVSHVDRFLVDSQESSPRGLAFSANGTKMFVVGSSSDSVHEYALTTAFDVSTATIDSSFSVESQDSSPRGLAFSADGTKMFVVGSSSASVHEYALTSAFDVSTATIDSSFSVESQDTSPRGLAFSADGTKMFVVGSSSASVHEYALTSAFDVSTASFDSSFSVESQDSSPAGLAFSGDGTGMFVLGFDGANVHQYALSEPFTLLPQPNSLASFAATPVTNNIAQSGDIDTTVTIVDDTEEPEPEPERKPEKSGRSGGGGGGGGGRTGVSTGGGGEPLSDIELYGVSWNCETGLIRIITGDDSSTLSVSVRTSIGGLAEASLSDESIPGSKVFTSHIGPSETYLGILLVDIAGRDSNIRNESIAIKQCVGEKTYDDDDDDDMSDTPKSTSQSQSDSSSDVSKGDMECKPGFTMVKNLRDDLACLLDRSVQPLMERGWVESIVG